MQTPHINLDQGLPDPRLFPTALIHDALGAVLSEDGAASLRYYGEGGPTEMQLGAIGLRRQLAERSARRDRRPIGVDHVMLANGSTDGLAVAVKSVLGAGDGAVVESATYRHVRNFMVATGADVRSTPADDDGMVIDGLRRTLDELEAAGRPAKLIYTIPTHQAPTGTVLPVERRAALVALAAERGVKILEDNCYYEFGYDGPPPPTLLSLADPGTVIHSDSFSKYLAPGLRMGWVIAEPHEIEACARVRQDFSVSQLMARALERVVAAGDLDAHVDRLRIRYRQKRDTTARLLREQCDPHIDFHVPSGGFFFWLHLRSADARAVAARLAERGVAVRTGEWFTDEPYGRRCLRLSPIQLDDEELEQGITVLGQVLAAAADEQPR